MNTVETSAEVGDTNLHGEAVSGNSGPVHPNSHASLTAESAATSPITLKGLQDHNIASRLANHLLHPVPHGPDGDKDEDPDYEEKLVRYALHMPLVRLQLIVFIGSSTLMLY